ncbi:aromatic-ring-hydroxylating dioxygenase subunit beta [soil metagenome]
MKTRFESMADVTRPDVEDFLYAEAALLDAWQLDEWLNLMTDDATYRVPSNDRPDAQPRSSLFTIADDINRIRARVVRLNDPAAHAEFPRSRTRRMVSNVRLLAVDGNELSIAANFIIYRMRRDEHVRTFVGHYRNRLRLAPGGQLRIAAREAVLDAHELGSMGAVSFIL